MIIQIIGSPATGKTFVIKEYIEKYNSKSLKYIDIADYDMNSPTRTKRIKDDIFKYTKRKKNIILESACGLKIDNSYVIKYKKDMKKVYANFLKRDGYIDTNYISILKDMEIKPNYIVSDMKTMHKLLDYLLNKKRS